MKVVEWIAVILFVVGLWFLVMWALWSLWGWVVPQLFTTVSPSIAKPSFWLFAGAWTLLSFIGRAIFGKS